MKNEEHSELKAWIAENVFKATKAITRTYAGGDLAIRFNRTTGWQECPNYTTDPAAAMEVLKKCIELADKNCQKVAFLKNATGFTIILLSNHGYWEETIEADTLELSICLFAKKLFSK